MGTKLVDECVVIDLHSGIKEIAVYVQREYGLSVRDAIMVATSIFLGIPLLSSDDRFEIVSELIFIYYET